MIDEHALLFAAEGHAERTSARTPDDIDRMLFALGVDLDAFRSVIEGMRDERLPKGRNPGGYVLGFADGFVIGVRAAREAARVEDQAWGAA